MKSTFPIIYRIKVKKKQGGMTSRLYHLVTVKLLPYECLIFDSVFVLDKGYANFIPSVNIPILSLYMFGNCDMGRGFVPLPTSIV